MTCHAYSQYDVLDHNILSSVERDVIALLGICAEQIYLSYLEAIEFPFRKVNMSFLRERKEKSSTFLWKARWTHDKTYFSFLLISRFNEMVFRSNHGQMMESSDVSRFLSAS